MKIEYLNVNHFGKLNNKELEFKDGINVVKGNNESGKTTIYTCIKSMFFGAERLRGRAASTDEYSLYEPWDNPGYYQGSMELEVSGKEYRIDRTFAKNNKNVTFTDRTAGMVINTDAEDISALMPELSMDMYMSTCGMSQGQIKVDDLIEKLNLSASADIDVPRALELLTTQRKDYEEKIKALQMESLTSKIQVFEGVEEQLKVLSKEEKSVNAQISDITKSKKALNEAQKVAITDEKKKTTLPIAMHDALVLAGFVLSMAHFIWGFGESWVLIIAVVLFMAGIFGVIKNGRKNVKDIKDDYDCRNFKIDSEGHVIESTEVAELYTKLDDVVRRMDVLRANLEKKQEYTEQLENAYHEAELANNELEAINTAIAAIRMASKNIQGSFGEELNSLASEYISRFTRGKYDNIRVHNNMKVEVTEDDKVVNMTSLSYATKEQIKLSIRLAASRLVFGEELMPILLDESLSNFDDSRLEDTLLSLAAMGNQVIVFTCHNRESDILAANKVAYNLIELD